MSEEKYFDAYRAEIIPRFYSTDTGGLVRIKEGKSKNLVVLDSAMPGKEFALTQPFAMMLRPIEHPELRPETLRKQTSWLENQLRKN